MSFILFVSLFRYNQRRTLQTCYYWIQTEFLGSSMSSFAEMTANIVQKECKGVNCAESHFSRLILCWTRQLDKTRQERLWNTQGMCISITWQSVSKSLISFSSSLLWPCKNTDILTWWQPRELCSERVTSWTWWKVTMVFANSTNQRYVRLSFFSCESW